MDYLFVGLGGVLGALLRFSLSKLISQRWPGAFPLATFFVNITGSFMLGVLFVVFAQGIPGAYLKDLLATGFMGAYTTYSTFSYEIVSLYLNGEKKTALTYLLVSVMFGGLAAYLGIFAAQGLGL